MRRIAILTIALAIPAFCQTAPAPAAGATPAAAADQGPKPKTKEENDALLAIGGAKDPDSQIKASEEFLSKFPDTDYKAQMLFLQANAYHMKKDEPKAIVAGEKSLDVNPKDYETLLLMSEIYSRTTRSTDLDMDDRLAKSDKYANTAMAELKTAAKPNASISDAEWAGVKQGETQRAYMALGFSALLRKKYDDAKTNFQKGIDLYPDPLDMLYIERAYTTAKRYDDALAWIDKAIGAQGVTDQVKKIAEDDKTRVQKMK